MTPSPDPAEALARAIRQSNSASPTAPTANERTLARAYLTQSERLRAAEGLLREAHDALEDGHQPATKEARAVFGFGTYCTKCDVLARLAAFLACQPAREAT
jgi:hypothetical protein